MNRRCYICLNLQFFTLWASDTSVVVVIISVWDKFVMADLGKYLTLILTTIELFPKYISTWRLSQGLTTQTIDHKQWLHPSELKLNLGAKRIWNFPPSEHKHNNHLLAGRCLQNKDYRIWSCRQQHYYYYAAAVWKMKFIYLLSSFDDKCGWNTVLLTWYLSIGTV